jgi:hypothetical protein
MSSLVMSPPPPAHDVEFNAGEAAAAYDLKPHVDVGLKREEVQTNNRSNVNTLRDRRQVSTLGL